MLIRRFPADDGDRVLLVRSDNTLTLGPGYVDDFYWVPEVGDLPCLDDPATRGCVLALARELHGDESLALVAVDESIPTRWEWTDDGLGAPALDRRTPAGIRMYDTQFASEADGLVVAIEAAP